MKTKWIKPSLLAVALAIAAGSAYSCVKRYVFKGQENYEIEGTSTANVLVTLAGVYEGKIIKIRAIASYIGFLGFPKAFI